MKIDNSIANILKALLYLTIITAFLVGCTSKDALDQDNSETNILLNQLKTRRGKDTPEDMIHVYPFRSGEFTFKIIGTDGSERNLVMLVDDYGHFESKKSYVNNGQTLVNWTVKRGLDLWHLDPETKEAILVVLKERSASGIDMDALIEQHGSLVAAESFLIDSNITLLPDETVQGYPCQVIQKDLGTYTLIQWVHKGIDLQMAIRPPSSDELIITRELISADFDAQISGNPFEIPENYTVKTTMIDEEN
ncbi:MAG: hypothetical protein WBM02_04595 [bacterium]